MAYFSFPCSSGVRSVNARACMPPCSGGPNSVASAACTARERATRGMPWNAALTIRML